MLDREQGRIALVKVSVIIPMFLAQETVGQAICSALGQTLQDIEVIVVDDGSPDASAVAAIAAGGGDERLRMVRLPRNSGVSAARNAGFAAARGRWITPLDADDTMVPERLKTLVETAEASKCDILIDDLIVALDSETTVHAFGAERLSISGPISAQNYVAYDRPYIGLSAIGFAKPLFKAEFLYARDVKYREHIHAGEDFDIVMQALLRGADLRFTPYAGYNYRRDRSTLSREKQQRVREAMVASSLELRIEAETRVVPVVLRALELREKEMLRWFNFDMLYTAARRGKVGEAFARFLRSEDKRYVLIRLIASLRYETYRMFGISLDQKKRMRKV